MKSRLGQLGQLGQKGGVMAESICAVGGDKVEGAFQELYDAMQKDSYWIRFFVRPCCPAPSYEGACERLDKLSDEALAREDFTDEQKGRLAELIESRKAWYASSGLCRERK